MDYKISNPSLGYLKLKALVSRTRPDYSVTAQF